MLQIRDLSRKMLFVVIVLTAVTHLCASHTYGPGICPHIEPIRDFDMTKFLGQWYAVQKTTTKSSCLIYNFKKGEKSGEYLLAQTSERYPTTLNISYVFDYTGKITSDGTSSNMKIHFPLNVAGSASFDVVTTDYTTYAGIYTCQNLLFFKRQSATFLSRTSTLDENTLKKMSEIFDQNFNDLHLSTIRHDSCNEASSQILLSVKSNLAASIDFLTPTEPKMITSTTKSIADVSYEKRTREVESIADDNDGTIDDTVNLIEPRLFKGNDQ